MTEDEKISLAIRNATLKIAEDCHFDITEERLKQVEDKVKREMAKGKAGDLAFVESTMFIKKCSD